MDTKQYVQELREIQNKLNEIDNLLMNDLDARTSSLYISCMGAAKDHLQMAIDNLSLTALSCPYCNGPIRFSSIQNRLLCDNCGNPYKGCDCE